MPHQPGEKYRPSNGSEGDSFMAMFCERCSKDSEENPCDILGRSMCFSEEDPEYPTEWTYSEDGPVCTAFVDRAKVERMQIIPQHKPLKGQSSLFD